MHKDAPIYTTSLQQSTTYLNPLASIQEIQDSFEIMSIYEIFFRSVSKKKKKDDDSTPVLCRVGAGGGDVCERGRRLLLGWFVLHRVSLSDQSVLV